MWRLGDHQTHQRGTVLRHGDRGGELPAEQWLAAGLFIRGVGFAATSTAVMAAAYRDIDHAQIPRATSALQIGQRIGAPFGSAILILILEQLIIANGGEAGQAAAYGATFWWTLALTVPAIIPALLLRNPAPAAEDRPA